MIYLPDIQNIYLGSSGVTKIMLGGVQVWPVNTPPVTKKGVFATIYNDTAYFIRNEGVPPVLDRYDRVTSAETIDGEISYVPQDALVATAVTDSQGLTYFITIFSGYTLTTKNEFGALRGDSNPLMNDLMILESDGRVKGIGDYDGCYLSIYKVTQAPDSLLMAEFIPNDSVHKGPEFYFIEQV